MSSSPRKKFLLSTELLSIITMTDEELLERQRELEHDLVLLDTQLTCYENGIEVRSDLWYKQATYVYHGKTLLLSKIANRLCNSPTQLTALRGVLTSLRVPYQYREGSKDITLTVRGNDGILSFTFTKKGELLEMF